MPIRIFLILLLLGSAPALADDRDAASAALDAFHDAASRGDATAYLGLMTPDVVFLGTDGTERWQGQEFRDFVLEIFADGKGWTYLPSDRRVSLSADGRVAWFDEALENLKLGRCRGSGVLLNSAQGWRIAQYNLSVPIPNSMVLEVAGEIVELQRAPESGQAGNVGEADSQAATEAGDKKKNCGKRFKTNRKSDC